MGEDFMQENIFIVMFFAYLADGRSSEGRWMLMLDAVNPSHGFIT